MLDVPARALARAASTVAPGAVIHDGVRVGAGRSIGSGAVIHAGTRSASGA